MAKKKRTSARERVRNRAKDDVRKGGNWIDIGEYDIEFFNPSKGLNKFDILPYEITIKNHKYGHKGDLWYEKTVYVHFGIGIEEKSIVCPAATFGKKCPICERRAALMKNPKASEDEIKSLKPSERQIFNVWDYEDDEHKLFTYSTFLFGKLLQEEIIEADGTDDEDILDFFELEGGKTLKVRFKKDKFDSYSFLKATRIDFSDRDDLDEDILDQTLDLDNILVVLPYEEIEKIFNEVDDGDEEDDEPKSRKKSKKKSSKKPKKKVEEEPEEEDDDPEEEEEEEEEEESDGTCPEGYEFGTECNKYDECDECEDWDSCQEAYDTLKEDERKTKKKKSVKNKSTKKKPTKKKKKEKVT